MFLAPVREQVAGYASSSLAMIQRCGHVCSVEQLDHFNRQSWRLSQRRHVSALNAWLGSSFKPLHRAHFWACSACLSCLRDGINCDSLSQYLVSGKTCGEINTPLGQSEFSPKGVYRRVYLSEGEWSSAVCRFQNSNSCWLDESSALCSM